MRGRKPRVVQQQQKPAAKGECRHYWVIESPTGPTSIGVCKYCGAVNEFSNYVPYPSWEGKVTRLPRQSELADVELDNESSDS